MLGYIRQMADRVKRRERIALLLVGLCSGIGLATAFTGRSAFLERPCSTFNRPASSESQCVDQIAVVSGMEADALIAPLPPLLDPPVAVAIEPTPRPAPGPLGWLLDAPPVSLRGPPPLLTDNLIVGGGACAKEDISCRHITIVFSGSS